jgi:hypothetical protein
VALRVELRARAAARWVYGARLARLTELTRSTICGLTVSPIAHAVNGCRT